MQAFLCLSRPPTFRLSICRKADGCDRQQRVENRLSRVLPVGLLHERRPTPEIFWRQARPGSQHHGLA